MASIYRRGAKYVIDYYDGEGRRRRKTGFRDKGATAELARELERKAQRVRKGIDDPRELRWAAQERRPLREHVKDWAADLRGAKHTGQHVELCRSRVLGLLGMTGAKRISHLDPPAFQAAIGRLHDVEGLSLQSCLHYVRAVKQFSKWLRDAKRCRDDRLAPLNGKGYTAAADRRHVRRELADGEIVALLRVAEGDGVVGGMAGPDRARLYLLAVTSGLRASELASLTPESFDLGATPPIVVVEARRSKRRKRDEQPVPSEVAAVLGRWLDGCEPGKPCFGFNPKGGAAMIRKDLALARVQWLDAAPTPEDRAERERSDFLLYKDTAGHVADFHALRHTYVSRVVRSGANPKVAQKLARHSTPVLTLGRYAHADVADGAAALERVPSLLSGPRSAPRLSAVLSALPLPEASASGTNGQETTLDSAGGDAVESRENGAFRRGLALTGPSGLWDRRGGRVDEGDGFENRSPRPSKSCNPKDIGRAADSEAPKTSALRDENGAVAVLSGSLGADIARVIMAWPGLTDSARRAILALCE